MTTPDSTIGAFIHRLVLLGLGLAAVAGEVRGEVPDSVSRAIEFVLKQPSDHPRAAVVDFAAHAMTPRFHVIDRASGRRLGSYKVAHGRGSEGKRNDGYAEVFSNVPASNASSLGLYQTQEIYRGKYPGKSMRLEGLSATNSNARLRTIVIHSEWYMEPEWWRRRKMLVPGRSEGCFVFSKADLDTVLHQLKGGALIYAYFEKPQSEATR